MEITVPTNTSFECREGWHTATFYQHKEHIKHTKQGEEKFVRLLFKADDESTGDTTILVGRNFVPSLRKGSELRTFLDLWLGPEFVDKNKHSGKISFDALDGRPARIVVKHIVNEGYAKAYVYLEAAYPPANPEPETFNDAKEGI